MEVDDDDAAQIAQAQLPRDLLRGGQIDIHGRLLLIVLGLGSVARVHVDDVHRLRVLDDQVGAALERHVFGEERLDLLRDVEVVEDRHVALVEFDDLHLLGIDLLDVVADLVVHRLVIDGDLRERPVERIADDRVGTVHLVHQLVGGRTPADGRHGLAPAVDLRLDVVLDVLVLGLHGRRADDDAEVFRKDRRRDALQPLLLLGRADLLRKEDLDEKGTSTTLRPASEMSAVRRGPFVEMASLATCTMICCPT